MPKNWDRTHNPEARPLGCNGKYGTGGAKAHRRRGEPVCDACRASEAHYGREYRRGQGTRRLKYGCGTWQRHEQHRRKGEPIDLPCRLAYNAYRARCKQAQLDARDPLEVLHIEADRLVRDILRRRRRRCNAHKRHTTGHCKHCGVHATGLLLARAAA